MSEHVPGNGTRAEAEALRNELEKARSILIPLTRAVDVFASIPAGTPVERQVWEREVAPALRAAQDYLIEGG